MAIEVFMPKMTDHMESAEIVRWLVAEGDVVEARQPVLEVMTDKVMAEVEAPAAGVLKGIRPGLEPGATVPVGETIAYIASAEESVTRLAPLQSDGVTSSASSAAPSPVASPPTTADDSGRLRATPAARATARKVGIDIALVNGTGPSGRVTEEDVHAFAQSARRSTAAGDEPRDEPAFEWYDLNPIQRLTGERMTQSARNPQFALEIGLDATNLLAGANAPAATADQGVAEKVSVTARLVRYVALCLTRHPLLNASYDEGRLKLHKRVNVGVALGSKHGLLVPVVKDADRKTDVQVDSELRVFRQMSAERQLSPADLTGGTFTISNLGMFGIDRFTAIINPPEAAILAVGQIVQTVVLSPGGAPAVRSTMSLTLSVDHRVVDGLQAAEFLADLKARVEDRTP